MLTIVENAEKNGRVGEMAHIKEAFEQHIIGFLDASYDIENNTLKSIIIDGTDLTNHRIEGPIQRRKVILWGQRKVGHFYLKTLPLSLPLSVLVDIVYLVVEMNSEITFELCSYTLILEILELT